MESVYQLYSVSKKHDGGAKHQSENYKFEKSEEIGDQVKMHKVAVDAHNATSHHTGTMYFEVPKKDWDSKFTEEAKAKEAKAAEAAKAKENTEEAK